MTNIFWIKHSRWPQLAIVAKPEGDNLLEVELRELKSAGIQILVSLLEVEEEDYLGLGREREFTLKAGMDFISYPIPDGTTPQDRQSFCELISYLTEAIRDGRHIGVHCRGSIGRSTVITASVLIELGWDAKEALSMVRAARGCPVPDTAAQRRWIFRFAPCAKRER
jgi:protein-tyrosine phosphatase